MALDKVAASRNWLSRSGNCPITFGMGVILLYNRAIFRVKMLDILDWLMKPREEESPG